MTTRSRQDAADGAALLRCGRGDAQAIEELYERYAGSCLTLAHSVLDDPHQAGDAVQEAFLDLWRNAAAFDPRRSSVRAWLHLMTHRKAVGRLRPEQRPNSSALPSGDDHQEEGRHPPTQGTGCLVATRTRQALAALPAADREALALSYWGGCSQREISTLTSTPLGTVKSRMLTAMNDLRRALGEEPPADEPVSYRSGRRPVPGDGRPRAEAVTSAHALAAPHEGTDVVGDGQGVGRGRAGPEGRGAIARMTSASGLPT